MKNNLFLSIFIIYVITGCSRESQLNGEVFIVTNSRQNIKLGLVEIIAIPEVAAKKTISERVDETLKISTVYYNKLGTALNDVLAHRTEETKLKEANEQKEFREWFNGAFFYDYLPFSESNGKAITDSDGKFTLTVPVQGKYLLAAHSERQIFDTKEDYYWVMWVQIDENNSDKIILSNNNLLAINNLP